MRCSFVPPYLLAQIASAGGLGVSLPSHVPDACRRTLAGDQAFRVNRLRPPLRVARQGGWVVHTANNTTELPGEPVRTDADTEASGDQAVDEAWDGVRASLALFSEVYERDSFDGAGARVSASVHYDQDYNNAFWDGTQLVFGDGDGEVFERFTKPVDVLAHEFTHAVTEHVAGLVYRGQSGALNESVSDVFAACLKQRLLEQTAEQGDWLVGEGLFRPGIDARGLRDMANPGTAYDDPALGKDPQGADMSEYVETTDDNGGVHLNSGIPNRAFQLAAVGIGGSSAENAGRIWWKALQQVAEDVDFVGFAEATVDAAGDHRDVVREAWRTVQVLDGKGPGGTRSGEAAGAGVVEVRRSGGIAGQVVRGRVDLAAGGSPAQEVRELLGRTDLYAVPPGRQYPDMFLYTIVADGRAVTLAEPQLGEDLRRLVGLVLEHGVAE